MKNQERKKERLLTEEHGHLVHMLPKLHCELNPIERVWAQASIIVIQSLRNTITPQSSGQHLQRVVYSLPNRF